MRKRVAVQNSELFAAEPLPVLRHRLDRMLEDLECDRSHRLQVRQLDQLVQVSRLQRNTIKKIIKSEAPVDRTIL